MSRLILVDLDDFCAKDAGVALSEEEELVKTRELTPGTVSRIVTASDTLWPVLSIQTPPCWLVVVRPEQFPVTIMIALVSGSYPC
jgi:hypothetical protein